MTRAARRESGIDDDNDVHHAGEGAHEQAQFGGFAQGDNLEGRFASSQRPGATGDRINTLIRICRTGGAGWAPFQRDLKFVLVHPINAKGQRTDARLGDEPPEFLLTIDGGEAGGEQAATKEPENSDSGEDAAFAASGKDVAEPRKRNSPEEPHGIEINRFFDFLLGHESREFSVHHEAREHANRGECRG